MLRCTFELCFLEMLPHLTLFSVVHFITIPEAKMRNGGLFFVFQSVFQSHVAESLYAKDYFVSFCFPRCQWLSSNTKKACAKQRSGVCLPNCIQAGSYFLLQQAPYCCNEPWRVFGFHVPKLRGCAPHACITRSDCSPIMLQMLFSSSMIYFGDWGEAADLFDCHIIK